MSYELLYAPAKRILMMVAGAAFDREIYIDGYDNIDRFVAARGPVSLILDLSSVEHFDISVDFARVISVMKPAIPYDMARYVVAPQPLVYGVCRMVQTLRSTTRGQIEVTRKIDEAYADLKVQASDFERIEASD
jgi:hypothetical protein